MRHHKKIVIVGAGAIGNYIGVQLQKSHCAVAFLGSKRVRDAVHQQGLTLEYPDSHREHLSAHELDFTLDPTCCANAELLIITVKSLVTEKIISQIQNHVSPRTTVLTLQNGVSNAARLKAAFPHNNVLAGMVTFNVIEKTASHFRLTTSGEIYMEQSTPSLVPIFQAAGVVAKDQNDISGMLWSKLLLNLTNPLNALSGLPLKENLEDPGFRGQWAACMREGLTVLKAAGIQPAKITPLPTHYLPIMLDLPNWIFLRLAKNMTDMDSSAKSSMAQDMEKGQKTEIDYLSGEIIQLGKKLGVATPQNERVYAQVKEIEPL